MVYVSNVNAYYNPSYNEIVFPAAFCNRLYNYQADEAVNYGGIAVIGHEISHGLTIQERVTMPMGI
jgi:predicted metalloendopeptidase